MGIFEVGMVAGGDDLGDAEDDDANDARVAAIDANIEYNLSELDGDDNPTLGETGSKGAGETTCGGESFTASTKVLLASGAAMAISKLKPGDKVLATNTRTGKTRPETVRAVLVHHDTNLYNLTIRTTHGTATIHTTTTHLFWTPTLRKWIPAAKLSKGELLKTTNGTTTAATDGGATPKVHEGWMWDLTIPGNNDHDFYVAAYGPVSTTFVLAHNDGCLPGVGDFPRKVVNSNMGHIDEERAARAGFETAQSAQASVRQLGDSIEANGFPEGTIPDTARSDRVLVPFGENGYAVYQIANNGNAVFKTILTAR
jgi:hypothetical protein